MKPRLHESTVCTKNTDYSEIVSCISLFDCSQYFGEHLGKSQSEQKQIVRDFQKSICDELAQTLTHIDWRTEYSPNKEKRDAVDICGINNNVFVVIELDKHRADQVAKKFVSRTALFAGKLVIYISLCYPGTKAMNSSECIKYFGYCKQLSLRMKNEYAGFIIE